MRLLTLIFAAAFQALQASGNAGQSPLTYAPPPLFPTFCVTNDLGQKIPLLSIDVVIAWRHAAAAGAPRVNLPAIHVSVTSTTSAVASNQRQIFWRCSSSAERRCSFSFRSEERRVGKEG